MNILPFMYVYFKQYRYWDISKTFKYCDGAKQRDETVH